MTNYDRVSRNNFSGYSKLKLRVIDQRKPTLVENRTSIPALPFENGN